MESLNLWRGDEAKRDDTSPRTGTFSPPRLPGPGPPDDPLSHAPRFFRPLFSLDRVQVVQVLVGDSRASRSRDDARQEPSPFFSVARLPIPAPRAWRARAFKSFQNPFESGLFLQPRRQFTSRKPKQECRSFRQWKRPRVAGRRFTRRFTSRACSSRLGKSVV